MIDVRTESEIVMFVPHLETGRTSARILREPLKFTCNSHSPVLGMYKQKLQGWRSARIISMSRQEITFLLDETQPPSGHIRIVVAGESGAVPFRAVCSGKVVRVVQEAALGDAVQVSAHISRWEIIKPKSRNKVESIR